MGGSAEESIPCEAAHAVVMLEAMVAFIAFLARGDRTATAIERAGGSRSGSVLGERKPVDPATFSGSQRSGSV
eukprot:1519213-Prymnesium_polylepis.1